MKRHTELFKGLLNHYQTVRFRFCDKLNVYIKDLPHVMHWKKGEKLFFFWRVESDPLDLMTVTLGAKTVLRSAIVVPTMI